MKAARWRRWKKSLGLRLVLLFLLLALAIGFIFISGTQRVLAFGYGSLVRPLMVDYVDRLVAEIGSPPDVQKAIALEARLPLSVRISGPLVQHGLEDDHGHGGSGASGGARRSPHGRDAALAGGHEGDDAQTFNRSTADGHLIRLRVSRELLQQWRERPSTIGWVTLLLLLGAIALAYHAVRRLFRPIEDIRAGAQRFGQGRFGQAIPVRRDDELGELATQVNTMARELQAMLDSQRALLLAISHELRSPLTRARLNAELVGHGEDSREHRALLRDLAEMRVLIEQLLEHQRLAGGHSSLQREEVDVPALISELLQTSFEGQRVDVALPPDLPRLRLDAVRVQLALRNLLANALLHGRAPAADGAQQAVRLSARLEAAQLVLVVRDFGPGVDEDQLSRLAQPFYRPDAARTRNAGGVGLGLALARMVAQAHGGSLQLRHAHPGLEATLNLPV